MDEVSRKEYLRKNRRRPVEQTVNELGEGRGKFCDGSLDLDGSILITIQACSHQATKSGERSALRTHTVLMFQGASRWLRAVQHVYTDSIQ